MKIRIAVRGVLSERTRAQKKSASDPRGFLAREIIVLIDHQRADAHQRVPKGRTEPRPSDGGERV